MKNHEKTIIEKFMKGSDQINESKISNYAYNSFPINKQYIKIPKSLIGLEGIDSFKLSNLGLNGVISQTNELTKAISSAIKPYDYNMDKLGLNGVRLQTNGLSKVISNTMRPYDYKMSNLALKGLAEPFNELSKTMASIMKPYDYKMSNLALKGLAEPFNELSKTMASIMKPYDYKMSNLAVKGFTATEQFSGLSNFMADIMKTSSLKVSGLELEKFYISTMIDSYDLDEADRDVISNQLPEEIQNLYSESVKEKSFYEIINSLYTKSLDKHPIIHDFIKCIFIPLIFFLFSAANQQTIVNNNTYIENHVVNNNYYNNVSNYFIDQNIYNIDVYNVVMKMDTKVYSRKSTKAQVVKRLNKGAIIMVLERNKEWTLIQYNNGDNCVEGYILNKYVKKL